MSYEKEIQKLNKKIDDLTEFIIKENEKIPLLKQNKKVIWRHFVNGLFRGFGSAIGFTILATIIIYILQKIVLLNLPIVSEYISDIIDIIEK